jgi:hypothetical protein
MGMRTPLRLFGAGLTVGAMSTSTSKAPAGGTEVHHWEYHGDPSHGQGFVSFAAVMIALAAVLNTLYGIAAIDNSRFFADDAKYVFGDLATWGWFVLVLGLLQFVAVFGIWRGAGWARWFGVGCAAVNLVLQALWFPSRPVLSLAILTLDAVALYGLLVYGGRRRAAREARASGNS